MGITLRAARVNKGLSQENAAQLLGVTKYTVSNWERGKSYPSVTHLKNIEKAYGIKYDNIIFLPANYA